MKNRRKKKFIDRKVQGGLILGVAAYWLLYFVLVAAAIPMWHMLTVSGFSTPFLTVVADSWGKMTPVFLFLAAMLPIFILESITFSHRFVGPIYRLHRTIRGISAGEEFQPLRFREDDFWHDLADDFNAMIRQLKQQQGAHSQVDENQEEEEPVAVG